MIDDHHRLALGPASAVTWAKKLEVLPAGDRVYVGELCRVADLDAELRALRGLLPAGGRVVVRTSGDRSRLLVAVGDDGEGMAAEVREKAFTPFFTTREEGTGLGLPLVRRVVDQHCGSVEISTMPGRGTTVTLVFPTPQVS